jgi:uncharacterized protein DUF5658
MHGYLVLAILGVVMTASSALAEDRLIANAFSRALAVAASAGAPDVEAAPPERERGRFRHPKPERPWPLPILYGSSAFLQSYDAYMTLRALEMGASEINPVLKPISGHPLALIAVKTGLTAASIFAAEKLWKDRHRRKAVSVMLISNAMMVVIAAHNTSVLHQIR